MVAAVHNQQFVWRTHAVPARPRAGRAGTGDRASPARRAPVSVAPAAPRPERHPRFHVTDTRDRRRHRRDSPRARRRRRGIPRGRPSIFRSARRASRRGRRERSAAPRGGRRSGSAAGRGPFVPPVDTGSRAFRCRRASPAGPATRSSKATNCPPRLRARTEKSQLTDARSRRHQRRKIRRKIDAPDPVQPELVLETDAEGVVLQGFAGAGGRTIGGHVQVAELSADLGTTHHVANETGRALRPGGTRNTV